MKFLKYTVASAALLASAQAAQADEIKLGIMMGFTGPLESIIANMAPGAETAVEEVNAAGGVLGHSIESIRADSTCVDAAAATAAAERLITSDGVSGIVGAACSGASTAALQNAAMPNGVVMISPSSTSPALSTVEDNGLFFRTAPSDARQGEVIAEILKEQGISSVAITYTNNDYGKGLADAIESNFVAHGGEVTATVPHEDGKGDYTAEVGALAAAGGEMLVVVGYVDQGGRGMVQSSVDTGAFDTFFFPDGMIGDALTENHGSDINGSFGTNPQSDSPGTAAFAEMMEGKGLVVGPYTAETYDAAALIMLAMEAAQSSAGNDYKNSIVDVANAPGEQIFPGELAKGLEILRNGGDIDYVGASDVELIGPGESSGSFRQIEIVDGEISVVGFR